VAQTFFSLFLKYKLTFRFPGISQQLEKISRNLKLLRNLWRNPARAALYAVTILTEMAFQETGDLLAVCGRLGEPVPVLLLNLATPARDCPLGTALNRREKVIKDKFQQTFAGRHQTVIYRQTEPRGLKRLAALGQALYRSGNMEKRHGAVADMPALSS
jgi:arsenite/tail-anchored protein-transporting ATPase